MDCEGSGNDSRVSSGKALTLICNIGSHVYMYRDV